MEPNQSSPSPAPQQGGGKGKTIAAIIIVIVVLLAIGWFVMSKKGSNETVSVKSGDQNAPMQQPAANNQTPLQTLKELMASGSSQKCDVNVTNNNYQTQGTVYVSGGKFRGDFTTIVNAQPQGTHVINDTQTSYVWMDGHSTGYKMAAGTVMNRVSTSSPSSSDLDPNQKYDYHCSGWSADSSQFSPPSSVNFMDSGSFAPPPSSNPTTGGKMPSPSGSNAQACAACTNAGANKAQCLALLKCN